MPGIFGWILPVDGRWPDFIEREESHLPVMDLMLLPGGGLVAFGRVDKGAIAVSDRLKLLRRDGSGREVAVLAMEMLRQPIELARTGDNISLLLSGVTAEEIAVGDLLLK